MLFQDCLSHWSRPEPREPDGAKWGYGLILPCCEWWMVHWSDKCLTAWMLPLFKLRWYLHYVLTFTPKSVDMSVLIRGPQPPRLIWWIDSLSAEIFIWCKSIMGCPLLLVASRGYECHIRLTVKGHWEILKPSGFGTNGILINTLKSPKRSWAPHFTSPFCLFWYWRYKLC